MLKNKNNFEITKFVFSLLGRELFRAPSYLLRNRFLLIVVFVYNIYYRISKRVKNYTIEYRSCILLCSRFPLLHTSTISSQS